MKKLFGLIGIILSGLVVRAQAPQPTGIIVGSGNFFSPIVSDLDKAIAFSLRNMFGLPDARVRS